MKKRLFLIVAALSSMCLIAQEDVQTVDDALQTGEGRWYASPWIWIIGAAIFILLLVALTKSKKDG